METQQIWILVIVSVLFLVVVVSIIILIGILGTYAFKRNSPGNGNLRNSNSPHGAPKSLGLLFMRMNFARIIIAITMVYGILVVVILGQTNSALISVFATLGGTSIGGLSYDHSEDNTRCKATSSNSESYDNQGSKNKTNTKGNT